MDSPKDKFLGCRKNATAFSGEVAGSGLDLAPNFERKFNVVLVSPSSKEEYATSGAAATFRTVRFGLVVVVGVGDRGNASVEPKRSAASPTVLRYCVRCLMVLVFYGKVLQTKEQ